MELRRFYIEDGPLAPGNRLLTGGCAHHLTKVMRVRPGERIILFDGSGWEYPATVVEAHRRGVLVEVGAGEVVERESPLEVDLGQGLCKPAIMDLIVQKATELGVRRIVPLVSCRSQGWLRRPAARERLGRWQRIATAACRQCGRTRIPEVTTPVDFDAFLGQAAVYPTKLILWEQEGDRGLKQGLREAAGPVAVVIGPEGGFTSEEVSRAKEAGFCSLTLGKRILRTETAAIAVLSILQYALGDLG